MPLRAPIALATALVLLATAPTVAASAAQLTPPSVGEFRQATREFLHGPAADVVSGPRPADRRGGGVGTGGGGKGPLLGKNRLLTLYGAPQHSATILGKLGPARAASKVVKQTRPYSRLSDRRIIPGFDLIAVVANSTPGPDRKYRTR